MSIKVINMRDMNVIDLNKVMDIEEQAFEFPWSIDIFKSCLEYNYICKVFEIDSELIGHLIAYIVNREVDLCDFVICSSFRRQGWGKKAFNKFLYLIKDLADLIWLEVRQSNIEAISFYEAIGFKPMGIRKGYYPTKHAREDAITYSYNLRAI